jgi:hypothetical protein
MQDPKDPEKEYLAEEEVVEEADPDIEIDQMDIDSEYDSIDDDLNGNDLLLDNSSESSESEDSKDENKSDDENLSDDSFDDNVIDILQEGLYSDDELLSDFDDVDLTEGNSKIIYSIYSKPLFVLNYHTCYYRSQ